MSEPDTYALTEGRAGGISITKAGELPPLSDRHSPVPFLFVIVPGNVHQEAEAEALRRLRTLEIPLEIVMSSALAVETQWQTLWRVMRDPNSPKMMQERQPAYLWKPLTKGVDQLRTAITDDERIKLWMEYLDFEELHNPRLDDMTDAAAAGVREMLKKKDLAGLVSYGSQCLGNYLLTLADPFATSPTSTSSNGSGSGQEPMPSGPEHSGTTKKATTTTTTAEA